MVDAEDEDHHRQVGRQALPRLQVLHRRGRRNSHLRSLERGRGIR